MGIWDNIIANPSALGPEPSITPPDVRDNSNDSTSQASAALLAPRLAAQIAAATGANLDLGQMTSLQAAVMQQLLKGVSADQIVSDTSDNTHLNAALKAGDTVVSGNAPPTSRLSPTSGSATTDSNGFILLPNGDKLDPINHLLIHADGSVTGISAGASQTAAEQAASLASANASNAAANRSNVLSGIDLQNAARAGQSAGPGYTWMPDGSIKQNGQLTDRDNADIQNANKLADIQQQNANTSRLTQQSTADYQAGELGVSQESNRLKGVEVGNTAAYQQGQLAQGAERLTLDKATAAADAAAKAQQNDLARQQYISKVLSSPSDFISRAFMQRGEASPSATVTQADLINQINREYSQAPGAFAAPSLPNANLLQPNAPPPTASYAFGTPDTAAPQQASRLEDPAIKKLQGSVDAVGKLLQHIQDPTTLHRLVEELSDQRSRLAVMTSQPGIDPSQMTGQPQGAPNQETAPALQSQPQRLAQGGMVNDRVAIVGDPQIQGVPNPEVIHNPTGAPISVTPMNRLESPVQPRAFANGTPVGWDANTGMLTSNGSGSAISGVGTSNITSGGPSTGYGTQASGGSNSPLTQTSTSWSSTPTANPTYNPSANTATAVKPAPTGYFNYENPWGSAVNVAPDKLNQPIPNWIGPGTAEHLQWLQTSNASASAVPTPISQAELVAKAEANLPPALKQLFGGSIQPAFSTINRTNNPENPTGITPLNFGFNLFSPQSLSQLTDAEKQALDSYLGVKYNTSLADVTTGVNQTFGQQATRGGRLG